VHESADLARSGPKVLGRPALLLAEIGSRAAVSPPNCSTTPKRWLHGSTRSLVTAVLPPWTRPRWHGRTAGTLDPTRRCNRRVLLKAAGPPWGGRHDRAESRRAAAAFRDPHRSRKAPASLNRDAPPRSLNRAPRTPWSPSARAQSSWSPDRAATAALPGSCSSPSASWSRPSPASLRRGAARAAV